jgi:hypothetical protein
MASSINIGNSTEDLLFSRDRLSGGGELATQPSCRATGGQSSPAPDNRSLGYRETFALTRGGGEAAAGVLVFDNGEGSKPALEPCGVVSVGQPGGAGGEAPAGYKDQSDKTFVGSTKRGDKFDQGLVDGYENLTGDVKENLEEFTPDFLKCRTYSLWATCPVCGRKFYKTVICGREWCKSCADEMRDRRIARWLPKAKKHRSLGYVVVEFPVNSRCKYRDKRALSRAGKIVTMVLSGEFEIKAAKAMGLKWTPAEVREIKQEYFQRGLRRWHWFNDAGEDTEINPGFNPHLNVLVPAGYLPPERLNDIKLQLRWALDEPFLIVNYSFANKPKKIMHLLRYINRNTFLNANWDIRMAIALRKFHNSSTWGVWPEMEPDAWTLPESNELEALSQLEAGICPDCGTELTDWVLIHTNVILRATAQARAGPIGGGWGWLSDDFGEPKPQTFSMQATKAEFLTF